MHETKKTKSTIKEYLKSKTYSGNTDSLNSHKLPVVCVQGLGFVGIAMAIAIASAVDNNGEPLFKVIGVELPDKSGEEKVFALNSGEFPLNSNDPKLESAYQKVIRQENFTATTDPTVFSLAEIIVVDIHLDVLTSKQQPTVDFTNFKSAIATIGKVVSPGALILIETTVPPGTCSKIVVPELSKQLTTRGLNPDCVMVAHSYERVMPGKDYYNSIVNFWRVYSGITSKAADATAIFLSKVINTKEYPLTRLQSTVASETSKLLENTYRAVNIAFINEWGRFAEEAGIDLFEIINAIRIRPTHSNLRQPGFGVGGYCLTKDPHLVDIGARELLDLDDVQFPFSKMATEVNSFMPLASVKKLRKLLGGNFNGKQIALMGVSYRQDVGDTRYSPSEVFLKEVEKEGGIIISHDPLVKEWGEMQRSVSQDLPNPQTLDAIVFAVKHDEYTELDIAHWLNGSKPIIFDANHVLGTQQILVIQSLGCLLNFIGKGV